MRTTFMKTHPSINNISFRKSRSTTSPIVRCSSQPPMSNPTRVSLKPIPISPTNFQGFGQLVLPTDDGKMFDDQDAQLVLDRGVPRFYIMRLPERGLSFDRITFHKEVTQCLGGLGSKDWYLVVAQPTMSVGAYPKPEDLVAFRVPPGVFLKLEQGTWHAGPLFKDIEHMDFYNLELKDTNVVDHNTHVYSKTDGIVFEIQE